ncbi:MAG: hypothetical protein JWN71_4089 [Xanthobacteraceae bacterium]|nr:hypothetical protein [Xanthobacteraceae bacterium]
MFFRKKKPPVLWMDPKTADWEALHLHQILLTGHLIQVNAELMERYINLVNLSEKIPNTQTERDRLKQGAEGLLRQILALKDESVEEMRARMPQWYEPEAK